MVERLVDNYNQARGYMGKMEAMEARLLRTGRLGNSITNSKTTWTGECLEHFLEKRQKNIRAR
jgi:hypothetical protein